MSTVQISSVELEQQIIRECDELARKLWVRAVSLDLGQHIAGLIPAAPLDTQALARWREFAWLAVEHHRTLYERIHQLEEQMRERNETVEHLEESVADLTAQLQKSLEAQQLANTHYQARLDAQRQQQAYKEGSD